MRAFPVGMLVALTLTASCFATTPEIEQVEFEIGMQFDYGTAPNQLTGEFESITDLILEMDEGDTFMDRQNAMYTLMSEMEGWLTEQDSYSGSSAAFDAIANELDDFRLSRELDMRIDAILSELRKILAQEYKYLLYLEKKLDEHFDTHLLLEPAMIEGGVFQIPPGLDQF